jgi:phospholipid/cholesterol/gamma-HCH transport system substrate-binding protein
METKAGYVVIGLFTLLAILAGLGFFLWLAKVEISQRYTQYDILFDQVSGLGQSSPVRFNGVDVGQVLAIRLDRDNPSRVRVRIEVAAATPVRQGTQAILSSQGVTGVAFVGLEGGLADAERLPIDPDTGVALIPSRSSTVQTLLEGAPDVLKQTQVVLDGIGRFTTAENAAHVTAILANLDASSEKLSAMVDDLTTTSASLTAAADRFAAFSSGLEGVTENADGAITDTRAAIADLRRAVADARTALGHIDEFATKGLPQIADLSGPIARLMADLSSLTAQIRRDPARFFLGSRTPEYNR